MSRIHYRWTPEDEADLKKIMENDKPGNKASIINAALQERFPECSIKKCRERYAHYLAPHILYKKLTPAHEQFIRDYAQSYNNKWVTIAKELGVSANAVKNYYHKINRQKSRSTQMDYLYELNCEKDKRYAFREKTLRKRNGINKKITAKKKPQQIIFEALLVETEMEYEILNLQEKAIDAIVCASFQ